MTNPTSNFGWQMPTASDLVTDLPADFETFGQAVDTSLADLKGGTTGQVLSKASNTDMDFNWVAQDDSNAIQNAIVDAKGDLVAASAADTPARLAVGANNTKLVAASDETTGMKWVGFQGCALANSAPQSIPNNTLTAVTFDTENFDTDSFHSTSTNTSRITIPTGMTGKYLLNATMRYGLAASGIKRTKVYKNGNALYDVGEEANNASVYTMQSKSYLINLSAGDYLELFAFQNSGGALDFFGRDNEQPFSIQYLGA